MSTTWFTWNSCFPYGGLELGLMPGPCLAPSEAPGCRVFNELPWLATPHMCCANWFLERESGSDETPLGKNHGTLVPGFPWTTHFSPVLTLSLWLRYILAMSTSMSAKRTITAAVVLTLWPNIRMKISERNTIGGQRREGGQCRRNTSGTSPQGPLTLTNMEF